MFHVICIEFRFHRNVFPPKDLMILRTGQRSQAEELDNVERELSLYDRDITSDAVGCIRREAQDIARKRDNALRLPGKQHFAIFGDLVLALFRRGEIVRVYIFQSNEHPRDTGPLRLRDEVFDFVAKRVDLDHQAERNLALLPEFDQAIEDRLPLLVARKIDVGNEEFVDPLRPVETHEMLHVVGRAEARLAALYVDDRAERALVRTATARVETRAQTEGACHIPLREKR